MIDERSYCVEVDDAYWRSALAEGELPPPAPPEVADSWPEPFVDPRGVPCGGHRGNGHDPRQAVWEKLAEWLARGTTFDAPVIGCNKGGLLVRVCDSIGFVPASQLAALPVRIGTPALRAELQDWVGETLSLRLIEVDPERDRVICSERAVSWEDDEIARRLAELEEQVGDTVHGTVRSVCDFGAFVDLDGVDGLIHISELSWQRIAHPTDVLAVDDEIEVQILSVDRAARRVALSYKRLHDDPWQLVSERYGVGDLIDAVVTNVVDFGAFARVPEGIDGLIHISELADGPFFHPRNVVTEGQAVTVRILHVDAAARRLGLSLRQAREEATSAEAHAPH